MKRQINKLENARLKYESTIDEVEQHICDKVEFEFSIFYQPSDGFVLLDLEGTNNAPIDVCLEHIKNYGVLTHEDYMGYCI